jgi:hypothetical protein
MLWSYRCERVGPMDIFLVEDLRTSQLVSYGRGSGLGFPN